MIKEPRIVRSLNSTSSSSNNGGPQTDTRKRQQSPQTGRQEEASTEGSGEGRTWQMDNAHDFPSLSGTTSRSSYQYHRPSQPVTLVDHSKALTTTTTTSKPAWGISVPSPPPTATSKGLPSPQQSSSSASAALSSAGNINNSIKTNPSKIIQRGETLPALKQSLTLGSNIQKTKPVTKSNTKGDGKNNSEQTATSDNNTTNNNKLKSPKTQSEVGLAGGPAKTTTPSAMDFFKPRPRVYTTTTLGGDVLGGSGKTGLGPITSTGGNSNNDTHTRLDGDEHALLRLLQERTVYQKKGRQRLAPRKKRFSPLKKKVLQERLKKWRDLHPENEHDDVIGSVDTCENNHHNGDVISARTPRPSTTLCILQYVGVDDLDDDDNYEEILDDLKTMAAKVGPVEDVYIPGPADVEGGGHKEENSDDDNVVRGSHPVFVRFEKETHAAAAKACWDGLVVGGNKLEVLYVDVSSSSSSDDAMRCAVRVVLAELKRRNHQSSTLDSSNKTEVAVGPYEIVLQSVLTEEDYDDDDCMAESLDDLKRTADQFGVVMDTRPSDEKDGNVILTYECPSLEAARNIAASLCGTVIGGVPLYAFVNEVAPSPVHGSSLSSSSAMVLLTNVVTDDDLEDEDCLNETLNDIKELCMKFGVVSDVTLNGREVCVTYIDGMEVAEMAVSELNGLLLGGDAIAASLLVLDRPMDDDVKMGNNDNSILLNNLLTQEDLEDDDCLEESLRDVREFAAKYGVVSSVDVLRADDDNATVLITFDGGTNDVAAEAVKAFDGMVLGGQIVSATLPGGVDRAQANRSDGATAAGARSSSSSSSSSGDKRKPIGDDTAGNTSNNDPKRVKTDDKPPLYSRDKLIPERFAEMKRVPKVTNAPGPRDYATVVNDESVKLLLIELLGELMRLQKRAIDENNTKAKRRLVMGLREVARGIRSHKVKMVVMANNLDEYGVIDDKLQEIIDLAKSEGVPLFFEFTKRTLGKALGKSIKIAVVGIQNADGAHQPFKKLTSIAGKL